MTSVKEDLLKAVARRLPLKVRTLGKRVYRRNRHWAHPALKRFGTVQDLYYWVADGNVDTLLLLQNYFSALYPGLNTETEGTVSLYSKDGIALGARDFSVAHCGCARFRVSTLLKELEVTQGGDYGTLEVRIAIPKDVLQHIQPERGLYFWDRFYIGYVNGLGQTCFVHGIDKTHIYREGKAQPTHWYNAPRNHEWAPEIPVLIDDYEKFTVVMANRTARTASISLTLSDSDDNSLSWTAQVPSIGVRRFELTGESAAGLMPGELRMRVSGMATQFGRPIVFKEFRNGAISAMHC